MGTLLKVAEVATIARLAPRSVQRRACELRAEPADAPSRNGKRGRLYHLASLNPALQQEFLDRQRELETNAPQSALDLALTLPAGTNLSDADRAQAEQRYRILEPLLKPEAYRLLWFENKDRRGKLVESIAAANKLSRRTIYAWLAAWGKEGLPGLVTRDRADKGQPRALNPAALDFILSAALPRPGIYGEHSIREIFRAYQEERAWRFAQVGKPLGEFETRKYVRHLDEDQRLLPSAQLPEASYECFRRWYARIPEAARVLARQGEEAFHNTQEIISFRALSEIKPLDYVVMDHRLLDLFCLVKAGQGWKLARPWLTAAIDMRTRKWLAWAVVETPSSDSIATVLKRTFLDHGIPSAAYWDNGKDFRSAWLEGGHLRESKTAAARELAPAFRGVMETLGVRVHHAIVKRARSKIIESAFIGTANFDKTLPEYCGHKPDARPEALEKLIDQHEKWLKGEAPATPFRTIEQIAGLYGELLDTLNEREHQSGEGLQKITATGRGWMSPNECWDSLIGQVEVRRAPAEVISFCFAKRRTIKVLHGEVCASFHGRKYHYRIPGDSAALVMYNSRAIEFAYDPQDLETVALYCNGRFLGLASNAELRRMNEESFVQDERDRRALRRGVKDLVEKIHQAVHIPAAEERAARRMAVRPARPFSAPSGPEVAVPTAITEAVAAARKDREFSFAEAGADLIRAADAAAYRDDNPDDDFHFFQEGR